MTRTDQERHRGEKAQVSGSSPRSNGKAKLLRSRSVRTRVAALVLLPLVATTILGAFVVQDSLQQAQEAIPAEHLTRVGVEAAELANHLNDERIATTEAALDPSDAKEAAVHVYRGRTDAAVAQYEEALESLDEAYFGYDIENSILHFGYDVDVLEDQRTTYDDTPGAVDLVTYYNGAIGHAEEISGGATDIIVRQREMGPTLAKAVDDVQAAADRARMFAIASIVFVVVVLGVTVVMTALVARSIIGPLRRLRATALDTANTNLPALVDRIQQDGPAAARQSVGGADVEGEDEIGQVATAFNDVHATAVRVASEQALLRQNLDTIVVNLSRRTQSLIDRQLGELEGLESRERDPDQLSTLFRIDHMATRVRRHADSLLILAGVDEMRKQVPASPVLDVVRGAVGEVEQYARIEFGVMPADLIAATAVHDTAHLLAELIDNATEFSAPSTPVTVTSQPLLGGGLRIQVTDTGLGIPPDQLTELNNRLNSPGDIDVAASRTLGLYVVARLANKHGIQVRLELAAVTSPGATGIVAQVDLPSSLILSPLDTTDDVMSAIQGVDAAANGIEARQTPSGSRPDAPFPDHNGRPPAPPVQSPPSAPQQMPQAPQNPGPAGPAQPQSPPTRQRPTPAQGQAAQHSPQPQDEQTKSPAQQPLPRRTPVQPLMGETPPAAPNLPSRQPAAPKAEAPKPEAPKPEGPNPDTPKAAPQSGGANTAATSGDTAAKPAAQPTPGPSTSRSSAAQSGVKPSVTPLTAREQTSQGSSLNAPKPQLPTTDTPVYDAMRSAWFSKGNTAQNWSSPADEGWRRAAEARKAAEVAAAAADSGRSERSVAADRPQERAESPAQRPATPTRGEHHRTPVTSLWAQDQQSREASAGRPAPQQPTQQPLPQRPAASAAPQQPTSDSGRGQPAQSPGPQTSASGLPVRQKGASLLPGSIAAGQQDQQPQADRNAPSSQPPVDVKHVASTLSSLQRGVSRGREETGGWVPKRPGGQGSGPERSSS